MSEQSQTPIADKKLLRLNQWQVLSIDTINPKLMIDMNYYVAGLNSTE